VHEATRYSGSLITNYPGAKNSEGLNQIKRLLAVGDHSLQLSMRWNTHSKTC